MLSRRLLLALALALPALVLGGCGYALVGRASNVPDDVHAVYLKPFANATQRAQVEQILTQAIGDELVTRHRFSVTSEEAGADAILGGSVVAAGLTPVSFDQDGRATEYEITIVVKAEFRRTPKNPDDPGEVIWSSERYTFREPYEVEVSETDYFDREIIAIEEVSLRFAETLVSDLLEGF